MAEKVFIVGIGETKVGRFPGRSSVELQAEAVRRAVADAGVDRDDVDGVYALGSYIRPMIMHAASVSEYLGLRPRFQATLDIGGTVTFIEMALGAIGTIEQGRAETVVCVYGDNAATRRPPDTHGFVQQVESGTEDFEDPFGSTILISYALLARRYLDLYQLEPEQAFSAAALTMRVNAQRNENAAYRKPITLDDYRRSPFVADPLRRLDCSPLADGAGAFVLSSKALAGHRRSKHIPVSVLGSGTRMTHKIVSQMPELDKLGMSAAGHAALAQAGVSLQDVNVTTIHDGFSVSIPLTLEQLGFCAPGEAWRLAEAGGLGITGAHPVNPHGGLLSQGHVGGVLHVTEAVRQLRGDAGERQIKDVKIALVAGNGGVFSTCGVMILGQGS